MGWLGRVKEWATRRPVARVDDALLGPLTYHEHCWNAELTLAGRPVGFMIGGRYEPDPAAIARARDIAGSFDQFEAGVAAYLAEIASREEWSVAANNIRSLAIRHIAMYNATEGMVFFDGEDEFGCWRCDLDGTRPTELSFDR
jgi:hypothetical protein